MKPIMICLALLLTYAWLAVLYQTVLLLLVPAMVVVCVRVLGGTPRQRQRRRAVG